MRKYVVDSQANFRRNVKLPHRVPHPLTFVPGARRPEERTTYPAIAVVIVEQIATP